MVSLRRRKLLGLCSGKSSFLAPHPKFFDHGPLPENPSHSTQLVRAHPMSSDDIYQIEGGCSVNVGPRSSNASGSISSKEQDGTPIKRRKRHRRKQFQNQEPCLMRGVYFKNMKWQAAIKVDKKQIHLGTVVSQEEAAHLYDRAAFMCGREPNFELSEEEKQELRKFKWEDFLAMTRCAITNKKHKRRHHGSGLPKILPEPSSLQNDESEEDLKQGLNHVLLASEEEEIDKSVSK